MINIKNLNLYYEDFLALNNINIDLELGKPMVILGESGAGKTSLARTLIGKHQNLVTGTYEFEGQDLFRISKSQWRLLRGKKISLMVQTLADSLNPQLKVLEQLIDALTAHKIKHSQALEISEKILTENFVDKKLWNRYPKNLSGGETQKILLSIALVMNPSFLILDEPTSALDSQSIEFILKRIKQISKDRYTLIITHDISFAKEIAHNIGILYGGELIELANKELFFAKALHPYSRGLLNSAPKIIKTKDLQGINGEFEFIRNACVFSNRCNQSLPICKKSTPILKQIQGLEKLERLEKIESGTDQEKVNGALGLHKVACHRGGIVKALEVKNLSKKFANNQVLKNISFDLYAGETLAIFGASGSGKSTLAKILVGLEKADSGEILLDKESGTKIGLVAQNPSLALPIHFNVFDTLAEPLLITKADLSNMKQKIKDTLNLVGLPNKEDFQRRNLNTLSGGELQRLALARALMLEVKILITDEITASLDVSLQAKVVKLLMQVQERTGVALIFISHDKNLSKHLADKVLYLESQEPENPQNTNST